MKKNKLLLLTVLLHFSTMYAQQFEVKSPDSKITLKVSIDKGINWTALLNANEIIKQAFIDMEFSNKENFSSKVKLTSNSVKTLQETIINPVPYRDAKIIADFTELVLNFNTKKQVKFRVYNDGIAYQFIDNNTSAKNVNSETLKLDFPEHTKTYFPEETSFISHNERAYINTTLDSLKNDAFCSLPVVFYNPNGKVLITESSLINYPGMFLQSNKTNGINAIFPHYVLSIKPNPKGPDRNEIVEQYADYIAKITGARSYPWRIFIITNDDRSFLKSNLSYQLAPAPAVKNTNWIKPGKVAWDWYNDLNLYNVNFKSGINNETYKYYIDFAAANNLEYIILDEGWTKTTTNIIETNPDIDIKALVEYGNQKGVGIILWTLWGPLNKDLDNILKRYRSWGVKGVKVDFMQRNDQTMVNFYERCAKACYENELLVDFHGAFKPAGLQRMYPNVINYEGVKGQENNKWSDEITPKYNVTMPFIRMAAGPIDYTPGSMENFHPKNFSISFSRPNSMGTRANEVAKYVIYESPLQMLCDTPSNYYNNQETVDFIKQIPTVWEETVVLHGEIGAFIAVAKKYKDKWYVGAMTNELSRTLDIDLSFLSEGNHKITLFKDGINSDRIAIDYAIENNTVTNTTVLKAEMSSGGGWSAIIE